MIYLYCMHCGHCFSVTGDVPQRRLFTMACPQCKKNDDCIRLFGEPD